MSTLQNHQHQLGLFQGIQQHLGFNDFWGYQRFSGM
jgi:hypothetical protein